MRKICHIITRLDMGGSAQNTLQTCGGLSDKYETVLAYGPSHESAMTSCEIDKVRCGMERAGAGGVRFVQIPGLVRRIDPLKDARALIALLRLIREERPDIVHTHTSKAGILGRLAARVAGVPSIVHTAHGHVFYGHFGRILSWSFLAIERLFSRFTDRIIALTEGEAADYRSLAVANERQLVTIHSGVDLCPDSEDSCDLVERRRSVGLNADGATVGFVGWLLPIKGPMHLLKAMLSVWPHHPATTLVFVGKGDQERALRLEADRHGLNGRVKFLGWRNDVREIMPLFDLLVLPSLNEGMGRVLVEAMSAGTPVVASRVGGIPDLVEEGRNGYLVPPGDEQALAGAIRRLIESPELAGRMGAFGRSCCRRFSLDAMLSKLDRLYAGLARSN